MIKVWLFYLGYFILAFVVFYVVLRILRTRPEIKDYGILTKFFVKYRILKEKALRKAPRTQHFKNFCHSLMEKLLHRIKIEALKIEFWATKELEKKKKNQRENQH